MARWSLKIVIDPKLRLVEKTHIELVERLKIDPNETQCSQGYEGTGVSFHICLNRKISSVEFFLQGTIFRSLAISKLQRAVLT